VAVEQHLHFSAAASWFSGLGVGDTTAFCRTTQLSFLRLLTQKIALGYTPVSNRRAWEVYSRLCEDDAVVFEKEPVGLEPTWRRLADRTGASPKVWMDAYLAAFAMAGGFRLTTMDRDFQKYEPHGLDLQILVP
jgi:toxin-antitoxin system PIN domain toxin